MTLTKSREPLKVFDSESSPPRRISWSFVETWGVRLILLVCVVWCLHSSWRATEKSELVLSEIQAEREKVEKHGNLMDRIRRLELANKGLTQSLIKQHRGKNEGGD